MVTNTSTIDQRPDIAIFVRALEGGGAQRDSILLANALASSGHHVAILTLNAEGHLAALVGSGVHVIKVGANQLRSSIPALRKAIVRLAPINLMSSEAAANVVTFLAVRSIPRPQRPRLFLREVASPSIARDSDPYLQNRIAYRLIPWVYPRADKVLTLTAGARRDLMENFGVPEGRIAVLESNAVIDPATDKRLAAAADAPQPRQPGLVVSIGRLSPEKNHLLIVEALARAPELKQARLVIAGEGPMRGPITARVAELGLESQVSLVGHVSDPFELLLQASLAVCSSRFEGLGNAVIEALACGTPVVSTDCPWGPREVLADGAYGELVPVDDADMLAAAMVRSLTREVDRAQLRRRAALFTADRAAAALAGVLHGCANCR